MTIKYYSVMLDSAVTFVSKHTHHKPPDNERKREFSYMSILIGGVAVTTTIQPPR